MVFTSAMVEKDARHSCLAAVRVLRVSLVDELEGQIDSLLEALVCRETFTRDDREEVLCQPGPRARVRKVLDILDCKGEEAAEVFLSLIGQQQLFKNPAQPPSTEYKKVQQKHKDVLRHRSESMLFYNSRHGEKILFSEHYVNLLLLDGHQALENKRHEVLAFGQKRLSLQQKSGLHRKITPSELFSRANAKRPIKKVLVTGVAGIGKTVLVQKILFDYGGNKDHLAFDFVIHMSFRDLNLTDKPTNLRELVLRKNRHLIKEMNHIFANDDKLLIILDGFDEFRHYRSCDTEVFVTEPEEDAEVKDILGSLLQGELLPNASIMLTSRPTAINHIPVGCIDRYVLIAGFSSAEVQDFFVRYFQDATVAERMFSTVSANELMLTLCYIPAFCYIVCCILNESKDPCGESPKTMTDIYVQYLVALLRSHTQSRAKTCPEDQGAVTTQRLSDIVLKLGRLAFKKLMEHQTLFYSSDQDVAGLAGCSLVSTFLDKTITQEPGCTEEVFSFAHLTVQEFLAALYCAVTDQPLPDGIQASWNQNNGHLDLFSRFLSGILSDRNSNFLSRQLGLCCQEEKVKMYRQKIMTDLSMLCENGAHILNCLHCLFEQQDHSLVLSLLPESLRVNVSDETLSQMDHNAIKYFLTVTEGRMLLELDLTGTGVNCDALRDIQPFLDRCKKLWLGENNLDMNAVQVIADVLTVSDNITHLGLGWTNIGDDELQALCAAIRVKKRLQELWVIWNNLYEAELACVCSQDRITVNFTDENMWQDWGEWVLKRCEVNSNEKLLAVLHKVCNTSKDCLELQWAKTFYSQVSQLVKRRIQCCTEEDMCKKLQRFDILLNQ